MVVPTRGEEADKQRYRRDSGETAERQRRDSGEKRRESGSRALQGSKHRRQEEELNAFSEQLSQFQLIIVALVPRVRLRMR